MKIFKISKIIKIKSKKIIHMKIKSFMKKIIVSNQFKLRINKIIKIKDWLEKIYNLVLILIII